MTGREPLEIILHINDWSENQNLVLERARIEERVIANYLLARRARVFVVRRDDFDSIGGGYKEAYDVARREKCDLQISDLRALALIFCRSIGSVEANQSAILEYFDSLRRFTGCPILNSPEAVRAGIDKSYLRTLEEFGLPVIPTTYFDNKVNLDQIFKTLPTRRAAHIIKPVCGECGNLVQTLSDVDDTYLRKWEYFVKGWMVQPFLDLTSDGEISLIFFGGTYIYAVRKIPALGQFKVNMAYKPRYDFIEVSDELVSLGKRALATIVLQPHISRVDFLMVHGQGWSVSEVEIVNPRFLFDPDQYSRRNKAIVGMLGRYVMSLVD